MKIKYFLPVIFSALLSGCNFLDIVPDEVARESEAYATPTLTKGYLMSCYSFPPQLRSSDSVDKMSAGETINGAVSGNSGWIVFPRGYYSPAAPDLADDNWVACWPGIRRCYEFLAIVDNVPMPDLDDAGVQGYKDLLREYKAEATFLIAYYHFLLLKTYGPVMIMDRLYDQNTPVEELPARSPYDDVVAFIDGKIDEALGIGMAEEHLSEDYGRFTKYAAIALRSRLYLYAASPLFNGNSEFYSGFKNKDGQHLISQTYDHGKWDKAVEASKDAIEALEAAGYRLYTGSDAGVPDANRPSLSDPAQRAVRYCIVDISNIGTNPEMIMVDTRREGTYAIQNQSCPSQTSSGYGNAYNLMLDVCGDYVQLTNTAAAFNTYCPAEIEETMKVHDDMLLIEYEMMGLVKNNAVPTNRMMGVRSWSGSPNWNGVSANYPNTEMNMLSPSAFKSNIWVFAHEFGHGNQIKPNMTGWGETTNNIFSAYVQYLFGGGELRLEHENIKRSQEDAEIKKVGGRFNAYLNEAMVAKKTYLQQVGSSYAEGATSGGGVQTDHFVKLAPLWQLTLYFMIAGIDNDWHTPDFWADINWATITDPQQGSLDNGQRLVRFMKQCMDASGLNLVKFFTDAGLLHEMDFLADDYGGGKQVKVTAAQVNEVVTYAQQFVEPSSPVISYISGNSIGAFKNKLAVQGTFGQGVTSGTDSKTIDNKVWKNAAVFETYAGNTLIDIAMAGTGDTAKQNYTTTYVRYPSNATRIEAVAWDGTRTLVFGAR